MTEQHEQSTTDARVVGAVPLSRRGRRRVAMMSPLGFLFAQLGAIATLTLLSTAVTFFYVVGDHDQQLGLRSLLYLDEEMNVPTLYEVAALSVAAALLGWAAALHRRAGLAWRTWLFLGVVFVYLSLDELFSLHERAGEVVKRLLDSDMNLAFAWTMPGGVFVVVVAGSLLAFLRRLDSTTRNRMCAAGAIYVFGAFGLELVEGVRVTQIGWVPAQKDFIYLALMTTEETLEMLGIALFNYTVLAHIRDRFGNLAVRVS